MNWEAVTALSTAFTGLVIAITALAALREVRISSDQARATSDQLEHLRKTTQFEGSLQIFRELDSEMQTAARHFVQFELAERMRDPQYRAEVALLNGADERVHLELTVLRIFERIAYYEKKGYIDKDTLLMVASGRIRIMWRALASVVAIHRESIGANVWSNFEDLYRRNHLWLVERGIDVMRVEDRLVAELAFDKPVRADEPA